MPKRTNLLGIGGRNFSLRAYLAGGGATAALIAAAVLSFGALGAYVAFEGLPVGGDEDPAGEVAVNQAEQAPGAPIGDDVRGDAGAVDAGSAGVGDDDGRAADPDSAAGVPGGEGTTAGALPVDGSSLPAGDSGSIEPSTQSNAATAGGPDNAPVGAAVGDTGGTTDGFAELPVGALADEVTGPLDEALGDSGDEASVLEGARDSH